MPTARRRHPRPRRVARARRGSRTRRGGCSAWRASTGTRSRPATPSSSGQHLVADRDPPERRGRRSSGRATGVEPERGAERARSRRGGARAAGARRARGAAPCRRARDRPLPAQHVEQHGLGLVVGGVRDEHRGRRRARRAPSRARRTARRARAPRGSGPGATVDRDAADAARRAARPRRARRRRRRALSGAQAVVDVHRDRREPGVGRERRAARASRRRRSTPTTTGATSPVEVGERLAPRRERVHAPTRRPGVTVAPSTRASHVVRGGELVERRQALRAAPRGVDRVRARPRARPRRRTPRRPRTGASSTRARRACAGTRRSPRVWRRAWSTRAMRA